MKRGNKSNKATGNRIILHYEPYTVHELWWICYKVFYHASPIGTYKKISYYNVPCSFDIETSSFYEGEEKRAIMYIWMLGIGGYCIIGREWHELIHAIDYISSYCGLSKDVRLPVYVHNLGYEFQFMRKRFEWLNVFSITNRKPCYCLCDVGIEFRCSYMLSGYSLEHLATELRTYEVRKLTGYLDYSLIRHRETPLTDDELAYCVNDVLVVMAYIQELIDREGDITQLPLTKTGFVRRYCKRECLGASKHRNEKYRHFIKTLNMTSDEYKQLRRAFAGGFTHANAEYSGKTVYNVDSWDFTSSYPSVMIAEKFPMSSAELIEIHDKEEFDHNIDMYCCLFDVEIEGLESTELYEQYLSVSHCWGLRGHYANNGRIVSAEHLYTTLTDVDYKILKRLYKWDVFRVSQFRRYRRGYLPTEFVRSILKLYVDKTTLKDVVGSEVEYMQAKAQLNSCYGMCVTDVCRDEITYTDDEWSVSPPDIDKAIDKHNNAMGRFLFYPWGVWVTAYARYNLFTGICECAHDYVYTDTDSIKTLNGDKHKAYIEGYNKGTVNKLLRALDYHQLPHDMIKPKTINGEEKPLGVWDYEGKYSKFKTLGAKRYLVKSSKGYQLTVAGLTKQTALRYMLFGDMQHRSVFDEFSEGLYIPKGQTGKNTHTYIDDEHSGLVTDYLGNVSEYSELSSVHLENADYSLSIGDEYARYLADVRSIIERG